MTVEDYFADSLFRIEDSNDRRLTDDYVNRAIFYQDIGLGRLIKLHRFSVDNYSVQSMARFIWAASLLMARLVEKSYIQIRDNETTVLELGAGLGLPSLMCALRGATRVLITEYPDQKIIDMLQLNQRENIPPELRDRCVIAGYDWVTSPVAGLLEANGGQKFDIILIADCVWMSEMHTALVETLRACLQPVSGRVHLTCYPHTGKLNIEKFLQIAQTNGFHWEQQHLLADGDLYQRSLLYLDPEGQPVEIPKDFTAEIRYFQLWL